MDVSQLINDLCAPQMSRRRTAAEHLSQIEQDARPAAVPLVRVCGTSDEVLHEYAIAALESLGPPAIEDATALAELLKEPEVDVAYWAATLLGRLGPAGDRTVTALGAALDRDTRPQVRQRVAWALGQIGPAAVSARAAIERARDTADPRLVRLAERALQRIES